LDDSDCSFQISPTNPSTDVGIFNIKGYITDTKLNTEFEFLVESYNLPPKFKQLPMDIKAALNTQITFILPLGEDEENLSI
jgi:hypothetical protein